MNSNTKIFVGMSGGVDSSVAALLLKKQGYDVVGLFMKNWEESDEHGVCQASKDFEDVKNVCNKIGIPYYSINFVEEYRDNVFKYFLEEYRAGFTPNPDIICNREIKFKVFLDKAKELGADYLATGHYCQKIEKRGSCFLSKAVDQNKDQTYFLYTINHKILDQVLFPLGKLPKDQVRKIAKDANLITYNKKDSTGICFIGERNFPQFLQQYLKANPGPLKTLDGKTVGIHQGYQFYTIGQRRGLKLGGPGEPWFVVGKDVKQNVIFVERGHNHPALFKGQLIASEISWINSPPDHFPYRCSAKIRYRQTDVPCIIEKVEDNKIYVKFLSAQRAITSRQSIVFYSDNICLGGAMIL